MLEQLAFVQAVGGAIFTEAIIFLSYILICAALFKSKFSRLATALAFGAAGIVIAGMNIAIMLSGAENTTLMLTLLPLTAYLPFSVLLYFLSDSGIFETAAVCSVGMLGVLILKSLDKILTSLISIIYHNSPHIAFMPYFICGVAVVAAAAGLVFITFRRIGKAFRLCIAEKNQSKDLLLYVPIILILLTLFYYLSSTAEILILIFTDLTALSIFLIIARLLNMRANLISSRRSEKELSEYIDAQRQGYDMVVRKMEAAREYRHDMRHHLSVIEGLAKQGENDRIIEYASNLNGSFGKSENINYCKNSELNALLSEYIGRAKNAGCKVTQNLVLPETFPFEEGDVCLILANAIENAINACAQLPEEKRYINISAEYSSGRKLLISVENPFFHTVEFDKNGLPVIEKVSHDSEEHGIGLRSAKRVAEKYNGFLRCALENNEFVFRAALFYDSGRSVHNSKKPANNLRRAAAALLGFGLGTVILLNVMPTTAQAASELLSVNIRTIGSFVFNWGSSSIDIQEPEFEGNGADELNSAVKNYVDEAKEKFWQYFNRRYNGYVGEDMKYTVIRDDEKYFIAQFEVTVNAGGSLCYSRWISYDKSEGKMLDLSDMFKEDSDYIKVLSEFILEQMKDQNANYNSHFYIEGEDAFTEISPDANFYIDNFDRLVIVFDEYEVAPGSEGTPQFFIPTNITARIAR